MSKKLNKILDSALEQIEPLNETINFIENSLKIFIKDLKKNIHSSKITAEVFVGGSFAKKTIIKKENYDVDVFVRFDKKYKEQDLSKLTKKILNKFKNLKMVHGSRDYFQIQISPAFFIEVIPVIKVTNTKQAENITDLSYSHVKYINKKVKSKKILDHIKLAKAFCHANGCYGAESYVGGFSGYSLELLIYHYKDFFKFIKAMTKIKEQLVIDIEKHHKNKQAVLMDINSSKLESPIILIDPTYKQRNTTAALSWQTFKKFQKVCKKFQENPSAKFFETQKTDLEKIKKDAQKNKNEFVLFEIKTTRQEGDIAGSKLLKFYNHFSYELQKYFEIKKRGFNYNHKQSARCFFVVKKKKEIVFDGPSTKDEKNAKKFKKQHKKTTTKSGKLYAKEKINLTIKQFIPKWKIKNKKKLREMYIKEFKVRD